MGLNKVAANHCTGALAIEKMIAAGIPVVRDRQNTGAEVNFTWATGTR